MGGNLKDQDQSQQGERPGQEDHSCKADKIGHVHRVAGKSVDAVRIQARLIWERKREDRRRTQAQAGKIANDPAPEQGRKVYVYPQNSRDKNNPRLESW